MTLSDKFTPSSTGQTMFDKVVVGGGPVGLCCAYEILRQAQLSGKKLELAVIAETVNSPTTAGSQPFYGMDGNYIEGQGASPEIYAMLDKGMKGFYETIEREKISCRETKGLEIKAASPTVLEDLVRLMRENNIIGAEDPVRDNSDEQRFNLKDHPNSIIFDAAGQVNLPELQRALIDKIRAMGGKVIDNVRYQGQSRNDGQITLHTNMGDILTTSNPLLVTGAAHLLSTPELKDTGNPVYTMSIVHGPLDEEDRLRIANAPVAFANENLAGDFLWGALDEKGYFSLGKGDTLDPNKYEEMKAEILGDIERLYPGLIEKYADRQTISYGTMYTPHNGMPVVGRLANFDVASGWGGRGLVPGYSAAQAYAQAFVNNNDKDLRLFEQMQPQLPFIGNNEDPTPRMAPKAV